MTGSLTSKQEFYQVSADGGCPTCEAGKMWTITYPDLGGDDVAIGSSWGDKELAEDICDLMNMAYEAGRERERPADETTVVTCTCPDVCKICGGRVSACMVLGHRPADARAVKWHECPTPAALRSDRDALYALLRDFALTPAGPRADAVWERVLRVIGPVDRTGLDTDPPGVGDVERRLAEETTEKHGS